MTRTSDFLNRKVQPNMGNSLFIVISKNISPTHRYNHHYTLAMPRSKFGIKMIVKMWFKLLWLLYFFTKTIVMACSILPCVQFV